MVVMDPRQPIGRFSYSVLSTHRDKFESCRVGASSGEDAEAIHQMRVNGRRLRTCMRAFAPVLAQSLLELEPELQWIAGSLGQVRDVDVQLGIMPDVADALNDLRTERQQHLQRDLESERYKRLSEALACRIEVGASDDPGLASMPVCAAAPDIVAIAHRAAKKAARAIDSDSEDAAVHTLRKRAKRLRYTSDCFAGFYGKPAKRFSSSLKELQDLLGQFQDTVITRSLCLELKGREVDELLDNYSSEAKQVASSCRDALTDASAALEGRWRELKRRMDRERRRLWTECSSRPE